MSFVACLYFRAMIVLRQKLDHVWMCCGVVIGRAGKMQLMDRSSSACDEKNLYDHVKPLESMEAGRCCEVAGETQSDTLVYQAWRVGNVVKTTSDHGGERCMRIHAVRCSVSKVRMLEGVMNWKGLLS